MTSQFIVTNSVSEREKMNTVCLVLVVAFVMEKFSAYAQQCETMLAVSLFKLDLLLIKYLVSNSFESPSTS